MKKIFEYLSMLAVDVRYLSLSATLKGAYAKYGRGMFHINLPPYGRITLRRGNSDYGVLRQVFGRNEYAIGDRHLEERIWTRYSDIVKARQTPVVVDAGANIGLASLWFANQYPKAKIVCIEPDPDNFRILKENLAASDAFVTLNAAAGSLPGSVSLVGANKGWATQTVRGEESGQIPVITINDALRSVPEGVPLIVKIDIEGFESDLFEANLEWLDLTFAVFIEPHDWLMPNRDTSRSFQKAFGDRDYSIFLRGENLMYVRRNSFSSASSKSPSDRGKL
jgi:FkbM family methyltransferase